MVIEFSESIRQTDVSPFVVLSKRYLRKYWSLRQESITVRCKTTEEKGTDRQKFKNEIRAFLYVTPGEIEDVIDEIDMSIERARKELTSQISVKIRAYEKELFYIKCIKLGQKPQLVLRALVMISRERTLEEVFTCPEYLFSLLQIVELEKPIFRKDIKFG